MEDKSTAELTFNNNNNKGEWKFPLEIQRFDAEKEKELLAAFPAVSTGFVSIGPNKYTYPLNLTVHADNLYNFEAREDDIWIVTFPRSGTTWTQELVWLIANNLNYDGAKREMLKIRSPYLEYCMLINDDIRDKLLQENAGNADNQAYIRRSAIPAYTYINNMPSPRIIKTHIPFTMLPPSVMQKRAKVVYVARNPRDVAVSYYHLNRLSRVFGYTGDFPQFWDYFERDQVLYGSYWKHIEEGWQRRHEPNVLFMFYEDMNHDLPGAIRKVSKFLDKTIADDEVNKLAEYLNIDQFRNNPSVNLKELYNTGEFDSKEEAFVRNGITSVSGWQKEYTPQIIERAAKWIKGNLEKTDLRFPHVQF